MANPDAPFGFKVYKHVAGGCPNRTNEYPLADAYGTALFQGDIVTVDGSGDCVIASAGGQVAGIFAGVKWTGTDGSFNYSNNWVASTATKSGTVATALVIDDPSLLYYAQSDGTMTRADVGQYVDIVTSVAGDATTGISGMQTSATGGAEAQFRLVDIIVDKPIRNAAGDQDMLATGLNAQVVLKPVTHIYGIGGAEA
jgi:hypothetical protein